MLLLQQVQYYAATTSFNISFSKQCINCMIYCARHLLPCLPFQHMPLQYSTSAYCRSVHSTSFVRPSFSDQYNTILYFNNRRSPSLLFPVLQLFHTALSTFTESYDIVIAVLLSAYTPGLLQQSSIHAFGVVLQSVFKMAFSSMLMLLSNASASSSIAVYLNAMLCGRALLVSGTSID
jgi:hypothetical protein